VVRYQDAYRLCYIRGPEGLLIAAGTGPWDRQNIRTANLAYSWVGKSGTPVNSSFTLSAFPGTNNAGFELHNYLTPVPYEPASGPGTIDTNASADWNQTNCISMDLQNQADGSAIWVFRWKTNAIPDGNGTPFLFLVLRPQWRSAKRERLLGLRLART
jgi:hypothetical protein